MGAQYSPQLLPPEIALRGRTLRYKVVVTFCLAGVLPLLISLYFGLPYLFYPDFSIYFALVGGKAGFLAALFSLLVLEGTALLLFLDIVRAIGRVADFGREAVAKGGEELLIPEGNRTDEIGLLMQEFTGMLKGIQAQAQQVGKYSTELELMGEKLRQANRRLQEISLTDELTEIGNRRHFDMRIREEIDRSLRFRHRFSLVFLDIDSFKGYNDRFGHPTGDQVLQKLARLLRSLSRKVDVPCRIGGEEFAVLLPETEKSGGKIFAERVRHMVESTLVGAGDPTGPVTVSLGVSGFPEDGTTPESLLRAADDALYQSKRLGKNRVTVASTTEA